MRTPQRVNPQVRASLADASFSRLDRYWTSRSDLDARSAMSQTTATPSRRRRAAGSTSTPTSTAPPPSSRSDAIASSRPPSMIPTARGCSTSTSASSLASTPAALCSASRSGRSIAPSVRHVDLGRPRMGRQGSAEDRSPSRAPRRPRSTRLGRRRRSASRPERQGEAFREQSVCSPGAVQRNPGGLRQRRGRRGRASPSRHRARCP